MVCCDQMCLWLSIISLPYLRIKLFEKVEIKEPDRLSRHPSVYKSFITYRVLWYLAFLLDLLVYFQTNVESNLVWQPVSFRQKPKRPRLFRGHWFALWAKSKRLLFRKNLCNSTTPDKSKWISFALKENCNLGRFRQECFLKARQTKFLDFLELFWCLYYRSFFSLLS